MCDMALDNYTVLSQLPTTMQFDLNEKLAHQFAIMPAPRRRGELNGVSKYSVATSDQESKPLKGFRGFKSLVWLPFIYDVTTSSDFVMLRRVSLLLFS